jgi:LTXXQ motif family protein
LFWPYAYGDLFYDALWPTDYAYYDPFWYYGYDDIYAGIFSPYNYDEYVQGPNASERMTALTQSVAQSCTDEAAEVTGWPIDQIQAAVQPNAEQGKLLDDLGNAVVKASDVIKSHCPTRVSFTPTDRLADMQQRLEGMTEAVNLVQPTLGSFYDALSDEQKARFNDVGAASGAPSRRAQQAAQNPQGQCGENAMAFPTERIDQVVHPNDAQRTKLDALQTASGKAVDLIKAACPTELPAAPPGRLAAEGKRLQAMLQAVQTIRPSLDDFYGSLSDDQKARFNTIGRQLFAER